MSNSPNYFQSRPCTYNELISPAFLRWTSEIHESSQDIRRKIWEFDFILDTLFHAGMLSSGKKGLGFAVGQEPLPALFCKYGCEILATDLDSTSAAEKGWVESNQHSESKATLYNPGICDQKIFEEKCTFRAVDMTNIPNDLTEYDFIWSSCALEHLGSIRNGKQFIYDSLECLKPGGVAVHTTEYNVTSNLITIDTFPRCNFCIFRRKDLEDVASHLTRLGYTISLNFKLGTTPMDRFVDTPPYRMNPHLRLRIGSRFNPLVATSYGLIIQKTEE